MEVGLLCLVLTVAVLLTLADLDRARQPLRGIWLLALATLIRLDAVVILAAVAGYAVFATPLGRRAPLALHCALAALVCVGGQTVARLAYYGDVLPNTYYTKMTGFPTLERVARGLHVLWLQVLRMNPLLLAAPLLLPLFDRGGKPLAVALPVVGQACYSSYVGGDSWEEHGLCNRFLCVVAPMYMILFAHVVERFVRWAGAVAAARMHGPTGKAVTAAAVAIVAVAAVRFNNLGHQGGYKQVLLQAPPLYTKVNRTAVQMAVAIHAGTTPQARVAVIAAGVLPYFCRRNCVDMLGKCDRHIARLPMHRIPRVPPIFRFFPGHMKWDLRYSIGELAPDVIAHLWPSWEFDDPSLYVRSFLGGYSTVYVRDERAVRTEFYVREGSPAIRWEVFGRKAGTMGDDRSGAGGAGRPATESHPNKSAPHAIAIVDAPTTGTSLITGGLRP
jgi:hypothetical protein